MLPIGQRNFDMSSCASKDILDGGYQVFFGYGPEGFRLRRKSLGLQAVAGLGRVGWARVYVT